jgi:hypothetical protein
MTKGKVHFHIFLHAVRTAVIFLAGFLIYDILVKLEKEWNKKNPSRHVYHFSKRKIIKFLLIFTIDIILLYILYLMFGVNF